MRLSHKTTHRPWIPWFAPRFALLLTVLTSPLLGDDVTLRELNHSLQTRNLYQAALLGEKLHAEPPPQIDITLPLARLARELQRAGEIEPAIKFYRRAVEASQRPEAAGLEPDTKKMLRIAASLVLSHQEQFKDACEVLEPIVLAAQAPSERPLNEDILANCQKILNQIGTTTLSKKNLPIAKLAFSLASQLSTEEGELTAKLGHAWSLAMIGEDPELAASELEQFIMDNPTHQDSLQAASLCIHCLEKAGDIDGTNRITALLLSSWPESEAAWKRVEDFANTATPQVPLPVKNWILAHTSPDTIGQLNLDLLSIGLICASQQQTHPNWRLIAKQIAKDDVDGVASAKVLAEYTSLGQRAEAERFATILIAPTKEDTITAKAREAGCRWAGREQNWSMLALASDSENIESPSRSRTGNVERLLAEALVQLGRIRDAAPWWNYLVDVRGESDFSTLLRCAEAETSVGSNSRKAQRRIEDARKSAGQDDFRLALVSLLEAELAIRRTNFDEARNLLEQIVRNQTIDAELRGRAQWLIGETSYLQRQFPSAIEAYRKVEIIDPTGPWVAASLVQAGKSFEQLGHQREASICYGNLLTRFHDTAFAETAQKRLAAIAPDAATDTQSPIRR